MISVMIAAAMVMQANAAEPRRAYTSCLKDAVASAKTAKIAADAFKEYAHKTCAAVEGDLKARLVSFNVKNGMSKKAAADDAEVQLDDYVYSYDETYRYAIEDEKPK